VPKIKDGTASGTGGGMGTSVPTSSSVHVSTHASAVPACLLSKPPKLRILETHMPVQAKYFRILGMFTEDPIERMHNKDNKYNIIFGNLKTFMRAEKTKHSRSSLEHAPETIALTEECKEKSKRKMGPASTEKKQNAEEAKKARKEEKVAKVLDKAQECIGNIYQTP
jgi:hypothetical protein